MCTLIAIFTFYGYNLFSLYLSLLPSWMFQHHCLDMMFWVSYIDPCFVFALV